MTDIVTQFTSIYPQLIRGDSLQLPVNFSSSGSPVDITGWVLSYTAKSSASDSDDSAIVKYDYTFPESSDSSDGKGLFIVPASLMQALLPGTMLHDLQLTIPASPEPIVKTFSLGKVKVVEDITLRVPTI